MTKTCELCGEEKDCRPYGPKAEWVCFPCGMRDPGAAYQGLLRTNGQSPIDPDAATAIGQLKKDLVGLVNTIIHERKK
jgi:hypothetical protein